MNPSLPFHTSEHSGFFAREFLPPVFSRPFEVGWMNADYVGFGRKVERARHYAFFAFYCDYFFFIFCLNICWLSSPTAMIFFGSSFVYFMYHLNFSFFIISACHVFFLQYVCFFFCGLNYSSWSLCVYYFFLFISACRLFGNVLLKPSCLTPHDLKFHLAICCICSNCWHHQIGKTTINVLFKAVSV